MIELPPAISNLIFCKCDSRGESYLMLFSQKKKKRKIFHPYDGIRLSPEKGGDSDTRYTIDDPRGRCAERNKPVTKGQTLNDRTRMRHPEESHSWPERRAMAARGWGRRNGQLAVTGGEFRFREMKMFWRRMW